MRKTALILGLVFVCVFLPFLAFAQIEIDYPAIPGVISPQEIIHEAESEADILPLFMAYLFRLILVVSFFVITLVIIYGGFLHIISGENPEKRREAKSWILSAIQGAIIILISQSILSVVDSRFLVFQLSELDRTKSVPGVELEWNIKDTYFQIPAGLLIEDTALNVNARDKIYDTLDAVDEAEAVADAIVDGGFQLLEIIEVCPIGMECDCDEPYIYPYSIPFSPHSPHPRPQNLLISPVDLDRTLNYRKANGLRKRIMQEAVKEANEKVDKIRESEFKEEFRKIILILESLLKTEVTNEKLRNIREELENLFADERKTIENLDKDTKNSLNSLLSSLPKARTGFNDSTYYAQFEEPWGPTPFGPYTTFEMAGCYVVSIAMVLDTLLEEKITPFDVRDFSLSYIVNGTMPGVVKNAANRYPELGYENLETMEEVLRALDEGRMVIMTGSGEPHNLSRTGAHAFVLTGIDREKGVVYRSDPGVLYIHEIPIHRIRRNNPDIAEAIYRKDGAEKTRNFFYSFLGSFKKNSFLENSIPLSLLSTLREIFSIEEACACCPPCPEISPSVQSKIAEIRYYMNLFRHRATRMIDAKSPIEEDLYQLYKVNMIKALGVRNVIPYTTLLLNLRYHEKEEVDVKTYTEKKELPTYYRKMWYFWSWEQWLENITYRVRVGGETVKENDPVTFYLENTKNKKIIRDAERLARRENWESKRGIPPYVWWYFYRSADYPPIVCRNCRHKVSIPPYLWWHIVEWPMSIGPDEGKYPPCPCPQIGPCPTPSIEGFSIDKEGSIHSLKQEIQEILSDFSEKITLQEGLAINIPEDITPEEFEKLLHEGIEVPEKYLTCGMEIPVGETMQLIQEHYIELLSTIDDYLVEAVCFLELQEIMNRLAEPCSCPCTSCSGCEEDPPYCGGCILTCDKPAIYAAHDDVLASRAKLRSIRNRIAFLTEGYFNAKTENVCHRLNEDIRSDREKIICTRGGRQNITKHELITRKLNYSRSELDGCTTRPEHLEDTLEGGRTGKMPLFGPIVEERDIPRYTKTKKDGAVINTHDLNWFCCSYSTLEKD